MNVSLQRIGSNVNELGNRFPLSGSSVSYSTNPCIQEVLKKCPQLEAYETSSFCLKKLKEVCEQKPEKILRHRSRVSKW